MPTPNRDLIQAVARIAAAPIRCRWPGCTASYTGQAIPPGWVSMLLWQTPRVDPRARVGDLVLTGEACEAALCPEHAALFIAPAPSTPLVGLPGGPTLDAAS